MKLSKIICILVLSFFAIKAAASATEAPAAGADIPQAPPWTETQSRLLGYKSQRQQLMTEMKSLRHEKAHLKMGSPQMKAKAQELMKAYKEYKEATEEYNKLLVIMKYRYPERFAKAEVRKYQPEEVPSLEDLESQLDLDGRLSRSLDKARQQFGASENSAQSPSEKKREPSSVPEPATDAIKSIREADPIRLKK